MALLTCLLACLLAYLLTCLLAYLLACLLTYLLTDCRRHLDIQKKLRSVLIADHTLKFEPRMGMSLVFFALFLCLAILHPRQFNNMRRDTCAYPSEGVNTRIRAKPDAGSEIAEIKNSPTRDVCPLGVMILVEVLGRLRRRCLCRPPSPPSHQSPVSIV